MSVNSILLSNLLKNINLQVVAYTILVIIAVITLVVRVTWHVYYTRISLITIKFNSKLVLKYVLKVYVGRLKVEVKWLL